MSNEYIVQDTLTNTLWNLSVYNGILECAPTTSSPVSYPILVDQLTAQLYSFGIYNGITEITSISSGNSTDVILYDSVLNIYWQLNVYNGILFYYPIPVQGPIPYYIPYAEYNLTISITGKGTKSFKEEVTLSITGTKQFKYLKVYKFSGTKRVKHTKVIVALGNRYIKGINERIAGYGIKAFKRRDFLRAIGEKKYPEEVDFSAYGTKIIRDKNTVIRLKGRRDITKILVALDII